MSLNKILLGAILLVTFSAANAGVISVSDVTASSTFYTYDVNNLVNGSGLSGNIHDGNWPNKWMTNQTVTGNLTFDLGSVYNLSSTSIWNYGGGCCGAGRSVKDLDIMVSVDGISYNSIGSFILNQSPTNSIIADVISLNTTAQYIRFDLNSNYGDSYTGLSEVQFNGDVAAVPEPISFALLALGFIGIGFSRKKKTA